MKLRKRSKKIFYVGSRLEQLHSIQSFRTGNGTDRDIIMVTPPTSILINQFVELTGLDKQVVHTGWKERKGVLYTHVEQGWWLIISAEVASQHGCFLLSWWLVVVLVPEEMPSYPEMKRCRDAEGATSPETKHLPPCELPC